MNPKATLILLSITLTAILFSVCLSLHISSIPKTAVCVKNGSGKPVVVYLTLGGGGGWVSDVYGIFGIKAHGTSGSFSLNANDSVSYTSADPFRGNISFDSPAMNCVTNIFEVAVNNYSMRHPSYQETLEISCVGGVNCIGKMRMYGGGKWIATTGYENIKEIHNDTIGANAGLIGVYPFGCTNCDSAVNPPICGTPAEACQTLPICNISRNARRSGGKITIELTRLLKK